MMAAYLRVGGAIVGVPVEASQDPGSHNVHNARLKDRNFILEEECQFCRSVLHVSQDPRIGKGKKMDLSGSILPPTLMMFKL
jgi:hypothetical protein